MVGLKKYSNNGSKISKFDKKYKLADSRSLLSQAW